MGRPRSSKGLPSEHEHHDKGIAFDGKGSLYINIGSPSNACQSQDRLKGRGARSMPAAGNTWRHLEVR